MPFVTHWISITDIKNGILFVSNVVFYQNILLTNGNPIESFTTSPTAIITSTSINTYKDNFVAFLLFTIILY